MSSFSDALSNTPPKRGLLLDEYLDKMEPDDATDVIKAIKKQRVSPKKVAEALTKIGYPISREAVANWRSRNQ